jgi:hypothetical protein
MIEFTCTCGYPFRVSETKRTSTVACPDCGKEHPIPEGRNHVTPERRTDRPEFPEDDRPRRSRRFHDDEPEPVLADGGATGTSTKAIVSLVLGLASFLLLIVTGLPALIVGFMALGDIGNSRGRLKGRGFAYAGITIGIVSIVLTIVGAPVAVMFSAVMKIRQAAARMQATNNMKQISIAMINYHDTYGQFPPAYTVLPAPGGAGQPGTSWRVLILPYIEEGNLYKQYNPQLPWDHPSNQFVQSTPIRIYQFPNDPTTAPTNTYYQVFVTAPGKSPHALFDHPTLQPRRVGMDTISDGSANTIMIAEAATPVPWASPQDLVFDPELLPPALGSHSPGFSIIATADGSTRPIPKPINPATLKALITRDGGEIITDPNW